MLVKELLDIVHIIAPAETAEDFDNVGLLVGNPEAQISGILLALDITKQVIQEAIQLNANLIVTHHPIMMTSVKHILASDYEGSLVIDMIKAGISLISAHTNLDKADTGTNSALCDILNLKNVTADGFTWIGEVPNGPIPAFTLQSAISNALRAPVLVMGDKAKLIKTLGLSSGGGSMEWASAYQKGADAFLTGEVRHHHALEAVNKGMVLFSAGHYATENPGMHVLCLSLQKALTHVECQPVVYCARSVSYPVC